MAAIAEPLEVFHSFFRDGKPFIGGNKISMADILLFAFIDFFNGVKQPLDPANKNLTAWFERMKARPSAAA